MSPCFNSGIGATVAPMQITRAGLDLIKAFEGFRGTAYRCPAGILTIGYGHTSAAGKPHVTPGLKMGRPEAARVLRDDLEGFSEGVRGALKRDINANQFSALVSFAYNVGLGAFRTSSVLRAVNAGDFEAVPRRLNLWVKAGPRVLPGLVKRRAAEGHLFMMADGLSLMRAEMPVFSASDHEAMDEARGLIEPLAGKELNRSTTVWSAIATFAGSVVTAIGGLSDHLQGVFWQWQGIADVLPFEPRTLAIGTGLILAGAATGWIISERYKKSRDDAL